MARILASIILLLRINFTVLSVCRGKVSKREAISGSSSSLLGKQRFIRRKLHVLPRFDTLVVRPDHHLNSRIRDKRARWYTRNRPQICIFSRANKTVPSLDPISSSQMEKQLYGERKLLLLLLLLREFSGSNSFDGRGDDKLERKIKLLGSKLINLGIMQMHNFIIVISFFHYIYYIYHPWKIQLWQTYNFVSLPIDLLTIILQPFFSRRKNLNSVELLSISIPLESFVSNLAFTGCAIDDALSGHEPRDFIRVSPG